MAANFQGARGLANLAKRLAGSADSAATSPLPRRIVHASAYDKNLEESATSDHVTQPQSEEYWAPHPKTGVFGPATEDTRGSGGRAGGVESGEQGSVLEQKAFVRALEDLEKPPLHP